MCIIFFFDLFFFMYFSIIGIRKYVIKRLYITYVTQVHGLVIRLSLLKIRHKRLEINRKTCEK